MQLRILHRVARVASAALFACGVLSARASRADNTTPVLSFYGSPGLLDMPGAHMMPDGSFTVFGTGTGFTQRYGFAFQGLPWFEGTFRYIEWRYPNSGFGGVDYDRSFAVRIRLQNETDGWPDITMGLNDIIGTGLQSGEYFAASKHLGPFDATLGIGWGRLAGTALFENPFALFIHSFANRAAPNAAVSNAGGILPFSQFFHGTNASLFGGFSWATPIEGLSLIAEYSSDRYQLEAEEDSFKPAIQVNFGASYQITRDVQIGAAFMYGKTAMLRAAFTMDPKTDPFPRRIGAQPLQPVIRTDSEVAAARKRMMQAASLKTTPIGPATTLVEMSADDTTFVKARARAVALASEQGLEIEAMGRAGTQVNLAVTNAHYRTEPEAYGRIARVLMATMPADIETFRIVSLAAGVPTREIVLPRSSLERVIAQEGGGSEMLPLERTAQTDVTPRELGQETRAYPIYDWAIWPQLNQSLFDPYHPFLYQVLAGLEGGLNVTRNLRLESVLQVNLVSDFNEIRPSDSLLPHVRSDALEYYGQGKDGIAELEGSYTTTLAPGLYGLARVGILESMFAGGGGEVLWWPDSNRWAIGATLYEVWQRGFDRLLDLQSYHVLTGHMSLYYQSPWYDLDFRVDAGRYLAGDKGATFTVSRRFDSGFEVGLFATFTNVPFSQFGEGSFDKGFIIRIPLDSVVPVNTQSEFDMNLRPVTRDGGQMLEPEQVLYETVRRTGYGDFLAHADQIPTP